MEKLKLTLIAIGAIRDIEAEGNVPLLKILDEQAFVPELITLFRPGKEPRKLDLLETPLEQGLANGDNLILLSSSRAAAGALPLNALYRHTKELKNLFLYNRKLQGISAIFLYTPADASFAKFLEHHLLTEIVHMSETCVLFVPSGNVFKANPKEFISWWESKYKGLDFLRALGQIHNPYYCTEPEEIYKLVHRLRLSGEVLPALVFFDNHPTDNAALHLNTSAGDAVLLHMLRAAFSKADAVNRKFEKDRMAKLRKELKALQAKAEKSGINVPFTLFSLEIFSPTLGFDLPGLISKLIRK